VTEAGVQAELPGLRKQIATLPLGGLTEIGFGPGERLLLLVSSAGRGLIDTNTGEKIAREYDVPTAASRWIDDVAPTVDGIGPLAEFRVPCIGPWGGFLQGRTDAWRLDLKGNGPRKLAFLANEETGLSHQLMEVVTEVRAGGFSNSGRIAVIAAASEVALYGRGHSRPHNPK
jgi:hypothetical protein